MNFRRPSHKNVNKTIVAVNQSLQCYCVESFSLHIIFRTLERCNDRHMTTVKSGHCLGKPRTISKTIDLILYLLLILRKENVPGKKNTCKYLAYLFHDATHGGFSNAKQVSNSSIASGVSKPIQSNCNAMANCNGDNLIGACRVSRVRNIVLLLFPSFPK